ncbi:hypothetical protein BD408DRAFT_482644 [Parasitella parasitica]|nr:hypothetical protein BD408DRAFT_482644 [Parasitella parasitica]
MSLQECLEALVANSKKASSIEFKESSSEVLSDLITRKRKLIREPEAHELKLQALCAGDFTTTKLKHDLFKTTPNRPNTKRQEIEKILKAANALNQISNIPEMKMRIEELAHIHEERQTNLDYLYEASAKYDAEIKQFKENEAVPMDIDDDFGDYDDSVIRDETRKVERLNQELEEKKTKRKVIQQKKQEQLDIRDSLDELQQKIRASMTNKTNEGLSLLENRILEEKQKIQELDLQIKALDEVSSITPHPQPTFKIRELSVGFKARIDRLLHSSLQEETTTDLNDLSRLFASIQKEIQTQLAHLKQVESNERHEQAAGLVYLKVLDFIQHHNEKKHHVIPNFDQFRTIFPNCRLTDTGFLEINKESRVLTWILSKLNGNGRSMLWTDLTRFVQELAEKQNYPEQEAIQCIHKLVGLGLAVIDRSQNESVVRLL